MTKRAMNVGDSNRRQRPEPHQEMQPGNIILMIVNYVVVPGGKQTAKLSHESDGMLAAKRNIEQPRAQSSGFFVEHRRFASSQKNVALHFHWQTVRAFVEIFQ